MGSFFPKRGAHNYLASNGQLVIIRSQAAMTSPPRALAARVSPA
ncbi:hypothetical protein HMPREF9056_03015 [Actinomyces sp. oral taxon 170 str. F0386]|nr:hypothetical protein HMPREF9056_03015 [Actinomyces sp. oral taxon 170 str. F0386]